MIHKRLFCALPVPGNDAISAYFDKAVEVYGFGEFKKVDIANIHLTIRFFGSTPLCNIPLLSEALSMAASQTYPFDWEISGFGFFQHKGGSGVLWMGVAPNEELQELHRRVSKNLTLKGFSQAITLFAPHITIARFKRLTYPEHLTQWIRQNTILPPVRMAARCIILIESVLSPAGRQYIPIATWKLGVHEHY